MPGSHPATCPACGIALPEDAPKGLCPPCLLQAATVPASKSSSNQHRFEVPEIGDLAGLFPEFEILELVGRGGMGAVFKVRQISLNRTAALKILPDEFSDDPTFAARFSREAQTLAALDHSNIVTVYDFGERSGHHFILMELVEGADLSDVIEMGGIGVEEARELVPQICDALQYAHDQGVIHRDIKPSNILLSPEGRVKLTDFGLAKFAQAEFYDVSLTATDTALGTPIYMAPEQLEAGEADHRSDIYALGVVIYQLLTGKLPHGNFKPPSELVRSPKYFDDIVHRAMESVPEDRYQDASEVKSGIQSGSAGGTVRGGQIGKSRRVALAVGGIGALALLIALFSGAFSEKEESLEERLRKASSRGEAYLDLHRRLPEMAALAGMGSSELHEALDVSRRILTIRPEHENARHVFLASIWHLAVLQTGKSGDLFTLIEAIEGNLEWFDNVVPADGRSPDVHGFYVQAWGGAARIHNRLQRYDRALMIIREHEELSRGIAREQIEAIKRGEEVVPFLLPSYHQSLLFAKADVLLNQDKPMEAVSAFLEGVEMLTAQYASQPIPADSRETLIAGCDRVITLLSEKAPERGDEILRHARIIDQWAGDTEVTGALSPGAQAMADHARQLLGKESAATLNAPD